MSWLTASWHKLFIVTIQLTQIIVHWEDIIDRFSSVFGLKKIIERRRNPMFRFLKLIPLLERLVKDLETAAQSPEDQAVVADVKALIAEIGATPPAAS